MSRMERAGVLKLYLIGVLGLTSLVVSGLVNASVIPVDDRVSQGTQYLIVGVLLGLIFGFFGGFEELTSGIRGLVRLLAGRNASGALTVRIRPGPVVSGRFDPVVDGANCEIVEPVRLDSDRVRSSAVTVQTSATDVMARPATAAEVFDTVARHESAVVDRLISDGVLTGDGPITDDDVEIMLVTSIISAELSERLLGLIDPAHADGTPRAPQSARSQPLPLSTTDHRNPLSD